ncbi:hypothetical protein CDES_07640 [Corynebacterium deserti GIMN1.010]|uniref:Uncharacterized protein n=1 Tax=Corynebacterium deserti GIMN1.010 TaxID=931089 RepID=A0A0M4CXF4_9CORY|nr:hypothetical protein [Corynebacterium deserti]ALC05937.1 hypothetical protein CDES_07640 [Corynebacterium deserti GIMN1.010]
MTDIIARTQQLLKGSDWDSGLAWKSVRAISEEKYVWSVQVFMGGRWIFMVTLNTGNSLEEAAKWFPSRERAEYFASLWEPDTPARVVKRRVSPVVVDG